MNSIQFLKGKKKHLLILGALVIGLILIICGSYEPETDAADTNTDTSKKEEIYYSEILERKIEEFLKTVDGIDFVKVFVTVDGGNELEYAEKGMNDGSASDYLVIQKGNEESAAVVREIYPSIRGVAVSCTNGNAGAVKEEITTLLSAALGISANKIMVTGYK